jgi:hypothetical protein
LCGKCANVQQHDEEEEKVKRSSSFKLRKLVMP